MKKSILLAAEIILCLLIAKSPEVMADSANQFITIVNPVRISSYTVDSSESIKAQYKVVKQNNLSATWLLTYDVIADDKASWAVKNMDSKQEIGIFLEITPNFSQGAEVDYHDTGSWHHAKSIFLSGYLEEERVKFIDTVFEKFKKIFGYFPASVGSWWTDSYSLNYMQEKYGITANLGCSDQFSTDGYQIWGQPWMAPYYPSIYHSGIPAADISVKLDLVNLQWAPRDPLNGYFSSLYSTQDYFTTKDKLDLSYFEKLVKLYASGGSNSFGQITVGLEGDFTAESYSGEYSKQLDTIKKMQTENFQVVTMRDFASWYRKQFPLLSPPAKITSNDLLGSRKEVVWYQSPLYRIGLEYNKDKNETGVLDFRVYNADMIEPYYYSPNGEFTLSINILPIIDLVGNNARRWTLGTDLNHFEFDTDRILIKNADAEIPGFINSNKSVSVVKTNDGVEMKITGNWVAPKEGIAYWDFSAEAVHFFRQKKFLLNLLIGKGWQYFTKIEYTISPGEAEALAYLSSLPTGRVMVYDNECLQCSWHSKLPPPAFANQRNYVEKYGKHKIVYDKKVLGSKNQQEAKANFASLRAKYIYLVKFEDYIEKLPFSPGDYGVEKVFENANAVIWKAI